MTSINVSPPPGAPDRRRRRRTVVKFALAGVALLGIGAAATSSAWTDDAWFSATASAATVGLEGSLTTGTGFVPADAGQPIVIPPATFQNMVPGESRPISLYLHNASSVPLTIPAATVVKTGALFGGNAPVSVDVTAPVSPLAAGAETTVTLTLTAPAWTDADAYRGALGDLTVQFVGTTVAP